jgi:hypothetical protein
MRAQESKERETATPLSNPAIPIHGGAKTDYTFLLLMRLPSSLMYVFFLFISRSLSLSLSLSLSSVQ